MEINRINYEKFFLLYLDRELDPTEIQEVDNFLRENADLQKEFLQLQKTVFVPEEIVFENKELLLRREEKRRVIPFYRMRIAAAIAGLILGSWFIISQSIKNPETISKNDQTVLVKKAPLNQASGTADKSTNSSDKKGDMSKPVDQVEAKDVQEKTVQEKRTNQFDLNHKDNTDGGIKDQNKLMTKNRKQTGDQNILAADNNKNGQNVSSTPEANNIPAESSLAIQKSSTALEIQPVAGKADNDPGLVSSRPGDKAPALLIAAIAKTESSGSENDLWKESDFQSENAISVVALNDKNKGISQFFKKLTKRAPEVDNAKKIRVSVFQFSY